MILQNSRLADISANKIVKTFSVVASLFILSACTDRKENQEQIEMPQVLHMPSKSKHKYLEVAPELLISPKDPVCGMSVKNKVIDTLTFKNELYGFCGTGCKKAFFKKPSQFEHIN